MARRGYPAEFRRRVIALVEGGKKVAKVSREFGISEQTIYVWRRQARIDADLEAGMTSAEHAELAAAKKRIRELFLAQRFAKHVSPLTTTVYTHPSDQEMHQQLRLLNC